MKLKDILKEINAKLSDSQKNDLMKQMLIDFSKSKNVKYKDREDSINAKKSNGDIIYNFYWTYNGKKYDCSIFSDFEFSANVKTSKFKGSHYQPPDPDDVDITSVRTKINAVSINDGPNVEDLYYEYNELYKYKIMNSNIERQLKDKMSDIIEEMLLFDYSYEIIDYFS